MTAERSLSLSERKVLAGLAEILVPRRGDMPSASEVDLAGMPIDTLLASRPDLVDPLCALLARVGGRDPRDVVEQLDRTGSAELKLVLQVVAGAYYMVPSVRAALAYPGQRRFDWRRDSDAANSIA